MPNYSSSLPPYSLSPGDVGYLLQQRSRALVRRRPDRNSPCRIPPACPTSGRTVRWQTLFSTAPSAINVSLQAATADVDAEYKDIDVSTNAAGEGRTVTGVQANFLRIKVNSSTVGSGAGFTAKMLV